MLLNLFKTEKSDLPLRLAGERLYIRAPERRDWQDWVAVRQRNEAFFRPWSPSGSLVNVTREGYMKRLSCYQEDWQEDRAYAFFIFLQGTDSLVGGVTLNNIVRGAGQMATIGYWLDEAETRQGYMTEAVLLACHFAFAALRLHRIQAGTLPENKASQKVLLNCGFQPEGVSRKYIRIAGEWRDHQMFSLLSDEFVSLGGSRF